MTRDNVLTVITAAALGWHNVLIETANGYEIDALIDPQADTEGEFVGLCIETGDRLMFTGWNCIVHFEEDFAA